MNMTQTQHVELGDLLWLGEADHDVPRAPVLFNRNSVGLVLRSPAVLIRARQTALCNHRGLGI